MSFSDSQKQIDFKKLSWVDVEKLTSRLLNQIRTSKEKFTGVVGIERGGLNISAPIAEQLQLPHKSIKISFYGGENKTANAKPNVNLNGVEFSDADHILFIDDLVDSGSTLKYIRTMLGVSNKFGCLFWNPSAKFNQWKPDYYVEDKGDLWLEFPWETA